MKVTALISIEIQVDLGEFDRKTTTSNEIDALVEQKKQIYNELLKLNNLLKFNNCEGVVSIGGNYDIEYTKEEEQQMEAEQRNGAKIRRLFDDKLEQQMNAIKPKSLQRHKGVVSFLKGFYDDNIDISFLDILDKPYIQGKVQLIYPHNWCFSDQTQKFVSSDMMVDPTIADIMVHFDQLIELSGDHHHVFLESIKQIDNTNQYRISTGS